MGPALRVAASLAVLAIYYWMLVAPRAMPAASARNPNAADQVREVNALIGAGRYDRALEPTLALTRSFPTSQVYLEQLASIYHHLNRPKDEAEAWERFVAVAPTPVEACPQIGDAYRKQGLIAQTIDAFDRCLAFEPDDPDMSFYAAHAAEWAGTWDRARNLYARALETHPRHVDLRVGLARVKLHDTEYDAARTEGLAALADAPDDPDAALVIGVSYLRQGHLMEARQYFERGLRGHDQYADLHLLLGIVEEEEGHPDVARRQYARAIALDPGSEDARLRLSRLETRGR